MRVDRSWLTVMLAIFGTRWFLAGSLLQKGRRIAGSVHFKGALGIRLLFGLGAPTALYGAGVVASSGNLKEDWWVFLVLGGLGIAVIAMWPEEIVTDKDGISQCRWFGLGQTRMTWAEVDYATEDLRNGNIVVAPREGRKIVHTVLHVGREDFLAVVGRKCRVF